jgi:hypothetical protein
LRAFKSAEAYCEFAKQVRGVNRFVVDGEAREFLLTLAEQAPASHQTVLPEGSVFWRAQLGHATEAQPIRDQDDAVIDEVIVECPHPPERMKPRKDLAREGCTNPKGISYLYLSNRKEIALAEVRPWIGSFISIAQFKARRNLRIVDFSTDPAPRRRITVPYEIPPEQWDHAVWYSIDQAFREPITVNDEAADYAATQFLAEFFKSEGFDGVAYQSAFQKPGEQGHNLVLFDLDAAQLVDNALVTITAISFGFEEAGPSYSIRGS